MITPIRIGGLVIHFSNLCYSRDLADGNLMLFMSCGQLQLTGKEAEVVRRYLHKHSAPLDESYGKRAEPSLPNTQPSAEAKSIHDKTTLLLAPNRRRNQ